MLEVDTRRAGRGHSPARFVRARHSCTFDVPAIVSRRTSPLPFQLGTKYWRESPPPTPSPQPVRLRPKDGLCCGVTGGGGLLGRGRFSIPLQDFIASELVPWRSGQRCFLCTPVARSALHGSARPRTASGMVAPLGHGHSTALSFVLPSDYCLFIYIYLCIYSCLVSTRGWSGTPAVRLQPK